MMLKIWAMIMLIKSAGGDDVHDYVYVLVVIMLDMVMLAMTKLMKMLAILAMIM